MSLDRSSRIFFGILVALSLAAAAFRFSGLEERMVWRDEAITLLRTAGFTEADVRHTFSAGRIWTVGELRPYQGVNANHSADSVVRSLALEDPQHPPLYYLLLYAWERIVGSGVPLLRALSVAIGIAFIPAMYWLCIELFHCRRTATIGATLVAVSPFFFAYSRELREYDLLALAVAVSGASLLRAQKSGQPGWWILYACSVAAGLYSDLFFGLALFGEFLYILIAGTPASRRYGVASIVAGVTLYVPWLATIAQNAQAALHGNDWSADTWPVMMLAEKWLFNIGALFFDLEYARFWLVVLLVPILAAVAYSAIFVLRSLSKEQQYFIGALVLPSALIFVAGDLALHAHRSAVTRYGIVPYIGVMLSVAAMLGYHTGMRARSATWRAGTIALLACGLACCVFASRQPVWWDNHEDSEMPSIAHQINAASHPLMIAPAPWKLLYTLSFRLKDSVGFVFPSQNTAALPSWRGEAFLVGTQDDESEYMSHARSVRLQPLYIANYDSTWQTFHRPLRNVEGAVGANSTKLSLWRIVSSPGISDASERAIVRRDPAPAVDMP